MLGLGIVQNSSTMVYCMTETNLCPPGPEIWECSTNKGSATALPRCSSAVCPTVVRCTSVVGQMVLAFMTVQLLFRFRKPREEAVPWPRQRSGSITSDSNISGDCVPAGFLEHVRCLTMQLRLFLKLPVLEVGCGRLADLLLTVVGFLGWRQVPQKFLYLSA
jgi:hypothetical protein